jgi:hypothetical protein
MHPQAFRVASQGRKVHFHIASSRYLLVNPSVSYKPSVYGIRPVPSELSRSSQQYGSEFVVCLYGCRSYSRDRIEYGVQLYDSVLFVTLAGPFVSPTIFAPSGRIQNYLILWPFCLFLSPDVRGLPSRSPSRLRNSRFSHSDHKLRNLG